MVVVVVVVGGGGRECGGVGWGEGEARWRARGWEDFKFEISNLNFREGGLIA